MPGQGNEVDADGELMLMDDDEELKQEERHLSDHVHLEHQPVASLGG